MRLTQEELRDIDERLEAKARAAYAAASEELRLWLWNPDAPCKSCTQINQSRPRRYADEIFGVQRNHRRGHGWKANHTS